MTWINGLVPRRCEYDLRFTVIKLISVIDSPNISSEVAPMCVMEVVVDDLPGCMSSCCFQSFQILDRVKNMAVCDIIKDISVGISGGLLKSWLTALPKKLTIEATLLWNSRFVPMSISFLLVETGDCYENLECRGRQIGMMRTAGVTVTRSGVACDDKCGVITIIWFHWLYFDYHVSFVSVIHVYGVINSATEWVSLIHDLLIHLEITYITKVNYRIPPTSCYQDRFR